MNRELFYNIAGIARKKKMTRLANILYGCGEENIKGTALCELPDLDKLYIELLKTPNMGLGTLRQFDGILKELGFEGHEYFDRKEFMNKRLENKITRWYGASQETRLWIAKHWYKWINGTNDFSDINDPEGFAEMSEYCYNTYWKVKNERSV